MVYMCRNVTSRYSIMQWLASLYHEPLMIYNEKHPLCFSFTCHSFPSKQKERTYREAILIQPWISHVCFLKKRCCVGFQSSATFLRIAWHINHRRSSELDLSSVPNLAARKLGEAARKGSLLPPAWAIRSVQAALSAISSLPKELQGDPLQLHGSVL